MTVKKKESQIYTEFNSLGSGDIVLCKKCPQKFTKPSIGMLQQHSISCKNGIKRKIFTKKSQELVDIKCLLCPENGDSKNAGIIEIEFEDVPEQQQTLKDIFKTKEDNNLLSLLEQGKEENVDLLNSNESLIIKTTKQEPAYTLNETDQFGYEFDMPTEVDYVEERLSDYEIELSIDKTSTKEIKTSVNNNQKGNTIAETLNLSSASEMVSSPSLSKSFVNKSSNSLPSRKPFSGVESQSGLRGSRFITGSKRRRLEDDNDYNPNSNKKLKSLKHKKPSGLALKNSTTLKSKKSQNGVNTSYSEFQYSGSSSDSESSEKFTIQSEEKKRELTGEEDGGSRVLSSPSYSHLVRNDTRNPRKCSIGDSLQTNLEVNKIKQAIAKFFMECNIPLIVVENENFINLVEMLHPHYASRLPNSKELLQTILKL